MNKQEKEWLKNMRKKLLDIKERDEINFSTMDKDEFKKWVDFLSGE